MADGKGPAPCPYCNSVQTVKNGRRRQSQWYKCRCCSRQYQAGGTLHGRHFPPEIIAEALRMFYRGMTYRQIAACLEKKFEIDYTSISTQTVYRWVRDYTDLAFREMTGRKAETGGHWIIKQAWKPAAALGVWTLIDRETGYVLASRFSRDSGLEHIGPLVSGALAVSALGRDDVRSCGFRTSLRIPNPAPFARAVRAPIKRQLPGAQEVVVELPGGSPCPMASLKPFGEFEPWLWHRFKMFRNTESAQRFLNGLTVAHNLFPANESNECLPPCQSAGVHVPYASWFDIVRIGASRPR